MNRRPNPVMNAVEIAQLLRLARELRASASEIRSMVRQAADDIAGLPWHGHDRNVAVRRWESDHLVAMLRTAGDLDAAADEARAAALAQQRR